MDQRLFAWKDDINRLGGDATDIDGDPIDAVRAEDITEIRALVEDNGGMTGVFELTGSRYMGLCTKHDWAIVGDTFDELVQEGLDAEHRERLNLEVTA